MKNLKKLTFLLSISMILLTINVSAYNRTVAKAYAKKWAIPSQVAGASYDNTLYAYYNGAYYRASQDCTNFVSQCLAAGGKLATNSLQYYDQLDRWQPHSATWENASYFNYYWKQRATSIGQWQVNSSSRSTIGQALYNGLYNGDVVQYGIADSSAYPVSGVTFKHSQVIHTDYVFDPHTNYYTMLMAQHTSDSKGIDIKTYVNNTAYGIVTALSMR